MKPEINICFEENLNRKQFKIKAKQKIENYPVFYDKEDIKGKVILTINGKDFEHKGIKIVLKGIIIEKKNIIQSKTKEFLYSEYELEKPGIFKEENIIYEFEFKEVKKKYESYRGENIIVKYFVTFIIETKLRSMKYEKEFIVLNPIKENELREKRKNLRILIEDEQNKFICDIPSQHIDMKGVIPGVISVEKLTSKISSIMLQIVKRETIKGLDKEKQLNPKSISSYEVLDGDLIEKEKIPIRIFLSPYNLTPSYSNIEDIYFVNYYLTVVITDSEGKKNSSLKEIILYRVIPEQKIEDKYTNFITANMNDELNKNERFFDESENK